MLPANRYHRVGLILCLPLLTLPVGCGISPLPLSVAATPVPSEISANSPPAAVERYESDDSVAASSSDGVSETTPRDAESPLVDAPVPDSPPTSPFDSAQLVGCWRDSFYGQRTLTLKPDGSATMLLELDFAGRLLYGKTLEFDLQWSLDGSTLSFEILTGRPVEAAKSAMKLWGEAFDYRLELVDSENLHGWASDDSVLYKLRRIEAPEADGGETR